MADRSELKARHISRQMASAAAPYLRERPLLVSVIIPVLNDTDALAVALASLPDAGGQEIIVVNGGASDSGLLALMESRPGVRWIDAPAGRGRQMNAGAACAHGQWLLFLHADTQLTEGWRDELRRLDADVSIVGGSFRFQLDVRPRAARFIEAGVAARVRWLNLPYGDQGLFVRHSVFAVLGGYQEWPLMEDVDFVRRLARVGRLHHSSLPAVTSARRWLRDGWLRRSAGNVGLTLAFFAGVSPRRLMRLYGRQRADSNGNSVGLLSQPRTAVAVMARAPSDIGGKTRLTRTLGCDRVELKRALLLDTLEAVQQVSGIELVVLFSPDTSRHEFEALVGGAVELIAQRGDDLGERLELGFSDLFARGCSSAVIVGSDLPTLPRSHIARAVEELRKGSDRLVLGPSDDGGYYLIGLRALCGELFNAIPWSSPRVFDATVAAAQRAGLAVALMPKWYDVDEPADLRRIAEGVCDHPERGRRTRQWVAEHRDGLEQAPADGSGSRE